MNPHTDAPSDPAELSVLVVAELPNTGKIRRHVEPLAATIEQTTMVCLTPSTETDHVQYETVSAPGSRYIGIVLLLFAAAREAWRGDYDAIVSISLVPYGCYGLTLGWLTGLPVHLAILGIDLDHHADAWYSSLIWALFRRFDTISVPGTEHERKLKRGGIDESRTDVLANAIDVAHFQPAADPPEQVHDFVWVGRFSHEKNPLLFVRGLERLRTTGAEFEAVMVGSGPLEDAVSDAVEAAGLGDVVELVGWADDPLPYYRQSKVFVLTSRREGLPLTLLEAMATGCASVVPPVGSVTDVAVDRTTSLVVPDMTPQRLATALEELLADDSLRAELGNDAVAVRESYSYEAAQADWRRILSRATVAIDTPDDPERRPSHAG